MKRLLLSIVLIAILNLPCLAKNKQEQVNLPNIFIADTTEVEEEIQDDSTLKGYAEFTEDEDSVYLEDNAEQFALDIKSPKKFNSKKLPDENKNIKSKKPVAYSKFRAEEYKIAPQGANSIVSAGDLSFGTTYAEEVDTSEFEQTTGFFTKYKKGRFAVSSAYKRTIGSTYNNYSDSIYIAPELIICKGLTIKEVITSNITYRTKKAELVLSINPFAYKDDDRLNFEIGTAQTYNEENDVIRNKIRFNTRFKL